MSGDSQMRILLVADAMIPVPPEQYGGIERVIDTLCREYVRLGHSVLLIAHPNSKCDVDLIALPGRECTRTLDILRNAITIARAVYYFKPHIVHSFGRLAQIAPLLPTSVPKIMSYQREPYLPGIARAGRLARRGTLMFTGCSDYIAGQIARVATGPATVYNAAPIAKYDFKAVVADDAPLVFLGRIERIKGVHNAIEIALRTGRRLIIAGNVPEGEEHALYYRTMVEPHLGSDVSYVGPVNDAQKNSILGAAAALIMAIEWNEPFGIVMAESLACGTPVLGTPRGAVPEVVEHGINGFLGDTPSAIAGCVSQLTQLDRGRCRQMFLDRFSERAIARQYLKLYEQMAV